MTTLPNIEKFRKRAAELEAELANPAVYADSRRAGDLARELQRIKELLGDYSAAETLIRQIGENHELAASGDIEMAELARNELDDLQRKLDKLQRDIQMGLAPPDPNDSRNTIVEIRAGTGGEEAALFAADLFRMYSRYADGRGWKIDVMDTSPSERGGFKEIVFSMLGQDVYKTMRYESGVHRVQRVPETEAQGRIHTSTASVAVLPEAEEVDVQISPRNWRSPCAAPAVPAARASTPRTARCRFTTSPAG